MKNEFIPYTLALEMKQLGFDEECIASYRGGKLIPVRQTSFNIFKTFSNKIFRNSEIDITAPLYQQAFRWFKENYRLDSYVKYLYKSKIKVGYYYGIDEYEGVQFQMEFDDYFETHEEAELECLIKLIKIVKENK
jgi:hypothetical protein